MTKLQVLQELLSRVGDPTAASSTFKSLAWSLFTETLYQYVDKFSIPEEKDVLYPMSFNVATDEYGLGTISPSWSNITSIKGVTVSHPSGSVPARELTDAEYIAMVANPLLRPSVTESRSAPEVCYRYNGSNIQVYTGCALQTIGVLVNVISDLKTALDAIADGDTVPVHNSAIYKVFPDVANKLKAEIGLLTL